MTLDEFKKLIQVEGQKRLALERKNRALHRTLRSFAGTHRQPFSMVYFAQGAEYAFKLLEEAHAERSLQAAPAEADDEDSLLLGRPKE